MLNRWVSLKKAFQSDPQSGRRPSLPSECHSVVEAEKWRLQVVRSVTRKVSEIQNVGLGEHKIRDLNDQINKLLREKANWQRRIKDLGGPDYFALEPPPSDGDSRRPGGYRYFGAARTLPGVKELFADEKPTKKAKTRSQLNKHITADYFGFRDTVFAPNLLEVEAAKERQLKEEARQLELSQQKDDDSDDDPALESHLLDEVRRLNHLAHNTQPPVPRVVDADALATKKRNLLAFLDADDDDDDDDE